MKRQPSFRAQSARPFVFFVMLVASLILDDRSAFAEPPEPLAKIYEKAMRASVEVLVDDRLGGTGWFVDAKGLIATAAHVVMTPGRRVEVLSPSGKRWDAKVLAIDFGNDVAVLQVAPRESGYPTMPFAERLPPPGEEIYLFGTPMYHRHIMLSGMVARDRTTFEYYPQGYVEVSAVASTIQGGVSGGPWFNRKGQVVGLQSGAMGVNQVHVTLAYICSIEAIKSLIETQNSAATPTLGISVNEIWTQAHDLLKRFPPKTEGLIIRKLINDGPASRAGLREWDLIRAIDGKTVRLVDDLIRAVRAKKPGDSVELSILGPDGTGERKTSVRLGKLEVAWP